MARKAKSVDRSDALKIAAASGADLRTVNKFFAGNQVKRVSGRAIEMAMRDLGIRDPRSNPKPLARA